MSIVWSLKRLFDPATHNREEGERRAERELPRRNQDSDPPQFEVESGPPPAPEPAQQFCCRVCGYESRSNAYCPDCLADTMQPAGAGQKPLSINKNGNTPMKP